MNALSRRDLQVRRLAALLAGACLLVILYATLFPFDFHLASGQSLASLPYQFDFRLQKPGRIDWLRNVLLFVPLGYGLACRFLPQARQPRSLLVAILCGCIALSAAIEVLQLLLPARESSLTDLIANSVGTVVGLLLFVGVRIWPLLPAAHTLRWVICRTPWSVWCGGYLVYLLLVIIVLALLAQASSLGSWDSDFRLALGNEPTGDRPWQGQIERVALFGRALTAAEVAAYRTGDLSDKQPPAPAELFDPLAVYFVSNSVTIVDQSGQSPSLVWQGAEQPGGPPHFSARRWVLSTEPLVQFNQQVVHSSQFSLDIGFASNQAAQTGPARILTISAGSQARNLTLGQEGSDLVVRLRTGVSGVNGLYPQLVLQNVLSDGRPHRLTLTYDGAWLRLYWDSAASKYQFRFEPRLLFFAYLLPVDSWVIRIGLSPVWVYGLLSSLVIWLPLALMLAGQTGAPRGAGLIADALAGLGIVLPGTIMFGLALAIQPSDSWPLIQAGFDLLLLTTLTVLWRIWLLPWRGADSFGYSVS